MKPKLNAAKNPFYGDWLWADADEIKGLEAAINEAQKMGAQIVIDQIKQDFSVLIYKFSRRKNLQMCINILGEYDDTFDYDVNLVKMLNEYIDEMYKDSEMDEMEAILKRLLKRVQKQRKINFDKPSKAQNRAIQDFLDRETLPKPSIDEVLNAAFDKAGL